MKKKMLSMFFRLLLCTFSLFTVYKIITGEVVFYDFTNHTGIFILTLIFSFAVFPQILYNIKGTKKSATNQSIAKSSSSPVRKKTETSPELTVGKKQSAEELIKKPEQKKNNSTLNYGNSLDGIEPIKSNVRFSDIAGYEETKKAVMFLVSCLKNNKQVESMGAKLPKGILLSGPPGTGKTFLAKAIAGESGVPFFSVDGSMFQDVYVGQGPRNVRSLYSAAMAAAPCVVFIDEIDAIGGARGNGDLNSERRNTLNALLVALDGVSGSSGILTIAATNTPDDLDPALVRAGRFDRKVYVPLPDKHEREQILRIHCQNKKISTSVDFVVMAEATSGFSGAALATMANEAALNAIYRGADIVEKEDFDKAYFQIMTDGEQKRAASEEERRLVAYHEAGHALILKLIEDKPIPYVTNIGSTSGVGGFTSHPQGETGMPSKVDMEHRIMVSYGGRAAEEIYCGNDNVTVGASADIKTATQIIRQYIGSYGMGTSMGMLNVNELLGRANEDIVDEAKALSNKLYQKTLDFLKVYQYELELIAEELMKHEVLTDNEINELLRKAEENKQNDN